MWTSVKPKFKKECILLTVTKSSRKEEWYYRSWLIQRVEDDDGRWYLGWCTLDGEEWDALDRLEADLYSVVNIPKLKQLHP